MYTSDKAIEFQEANFREVAFPPILKENVTSFSGDVTHQRKQKAESLEKESLKILTGSQTS